MQDMTPRPPVGALLRPDSRIFQIFGANTDVGKTICTTALCRASACKSEETTRYLKPVSTGPADTADAKCKSILISSFRGLSVTDYTFHLQTNKVIGVEQRIADFHRYLDMSRSTPLESLARLYTSMIFPSAPIVLPKRQIK